MSHDGGIRKNEGKLRMDLVPPELERAFAEVAGAAAEAKKYPERNWERGLSYMSTVASLKRHLNKFLDANEDDIDPEFELHHLKHMLWNAAVLVTFIERGMCDRFDDRPHVTDSKEE